MVHQCCHQEGCSNSHHTRQLLEGTDSDQHLSKPTQSPSTFLLHFCLNPRIPIFSSPTAPSYLMFPSSSDNTSCPDERKGPLCQRDRQTNRLKKKKNYVHILTPRTSQEPLNRGRTFADALEPSRHDPVCVSSEVLMPSEVPGHLNCDPTCLEDSQEAPHQNQYDLSQPSSGDTLS